MTSRDNRGGPRVPDGQARPASLPFGQASQRTDLSELPGTPGTPLPPSPAQPDPVRYGQTQSLRQRLMGIPLEQNQGTALLNDPTTNPDEPVTAGINLGAGPGADSLIPSPVSLSQQQTSQEMKLAYPLLMRLATLPNATSETKILAQRIRANMPLGPEQMPTPGPGHGLDRPT